MTRKGVLQHEEPAVQGPGEARQGVPGRAPRDGGPIDVWVWVRGPECPEQQGEACDWSKLLT